MKNRFLGSHGMSLVEVMIGAMILALAVVPSMTVIFRETRTVTATRDHLSAALWGQKLLEITRNYRFDLLDADADGIAGVSGMPEKTLEWALKQDPTLNRETINNIEYTVVNVKVDPVRNVQAPTRQPIMMLVSFGVAYTGADGRPHVLDVATAIFQE